MYALGRRGKWQGTVLHVRVMTYTPLSGDASIVLQDKSEIERMKANILRRVEEFSDEDEESDRDDYDEGEIVKVKLGGDGEESDEETGERSARDVEAILELAYIADPKQFDRDVQTRRSQARMKLRAQTGRILCSRCGLIHSLCLLVGWVDEQIEGWRVMLERNVSAESIDR
jgi:activating signal cointegrator complex subunit 2